MVFEVQLRINVFFSRNNYTRICGSNNNSLQVVELSGHADLHIFVNASHQTVSSTVFRIRVSLQRLSWLITHQSRKDPQDSSRSWLHIMLSGDVHPNHCPTRKYPCPVCSQCYRSWGELFMQSLFWMGTFKVLWSSKHSRVQTN